MMLLIFGRNSKKQKEEEARQREQEARELEMSFAMQHDEMDNLPEFEPEDDIMESKVVQEPTPEPKHTESVVTGDGEKDGITAESEDDIEEAEAIKLVKISARINEKVDEVMKDMAKEFDVPFSQVVRLAID